MLGGRWGKWLLFRRKQHIFTWCFSWSLLSSPGQSCRRSVRFVRTYHQCFRRLFPRSGNGVSDFQDFPPFPNWNRHDVMMSFIEFTGVMEESGRFPDPCEMHCPNSKKSEKRCRWKQSKDKYHTPGRATSSSVELRGQQFCAEASDQQLHFEFGKKDNAIRSFASQQNWIHLVRLQHLWSLREISVARIIQECRWSQTYCRALWSSSPQTAW